MFKPLHIPTFPHSHIPLPYKINRGSESGRAAQPILNLKPNLSFKSLFIIIKNIGTGVEEEKEDEEEKKKKKKKKDGRGRAAAHPGLFPPIRRVLHKR